MSKANTNSARTKLTLDSQRLYEAGAKSEIGRCRRFEKVIPAAQATLIHGPGERKRSVE
jgi:hypothetical protein